MHSIRDCLGGWYSRKDFQNRREEITKYWAGESLTPDEDKKFLLKKIIELGRDKVLRSDEPTTEHVVGTILGCHLRVETDILDKSESLIKTWTAGRYIAKIHSMVCCYKIKDKNKKGAPIHSAKNPYAKYLLHSRNVNKSGLDKLFYRSDRYLKDKYCRWWSSTDLLNKYLEMINGKLLDKISKSGINEPVSLVSLMSSSYMLLQKGAIQASSQADIESNNMHNNIATEAKNYYFKVDTNYIYTMLIAPISVIMQFEPICRIILTNQMTGYTKDELHIPIKHKAKGSEYLGRTYNVFCSIHSHERHKLGYIGYDMSAAMQYLPALNQGQAR